MCVISGFISLQSGSEHLCITCRKFRTFYFKQQHINNFRHYFCHFGQISDNSFGKFAATMLRESDVFTAAWRLYEYTNEKISQILLIKPLHKSSISTRVRAGIKEKQYFFKKWETLHFVQFLISLCSEMWPTLMQTKPRCSNLYLKRKYNALGCKK